MNTFFQHPTADRATRSPFLRRIGALALLAATLGAAGPALAGSCKTTETGTGEAKNNELLAKSRAREDWRNTVQRKHGGAFDNWAKSTPKSLQCNTTGSLGRRTSKCSAVSTPCS